jgi:hypothetical protein
MTNTNIKNLPAGEYMTRCGYSDRDVWAVIKSTAKTKTLAKVEVERDPSWKPEFIPGGFAAHCTNQYDQTWLYTCIDREHTVTIRDTKRGWARKGERYIEGARQFYDYNF